jgi:methylthioribose-1-phosphate isomerase
MIDQVDENDVLSPLRWHDGVLALLDQRALPEREVWLEYRDHAAVAQAIKDMVVRGAPAIGCAAAYAMALAAQNGANLDEAAALLRGARPTAVNLAWAVEQMLLVQPRTADRLAQRAVALHRLDLLACISIGQRGAPLVPEGAVLTHCNAGALATGGYGTALGVIRAVHRSGRKLRVYADETRPFLQGARLTAWELQKSGIEVTVITDNMAAHLMQRGEIQSVVVGADRIAKNGDTANKIGTYGLALLARAHELPFFVAAPRSTIDLATPDGRHIPIEERDGREVTHLGERALVPAGVGVRNPAFDVTPAALIAAIITEAGVARPPYHESLPALCGIR